MEIRLPYPHTGQQLITSQARRINILAAGRRWRKTSGPGFEAAILAAVAGKQWLWGAPTFDQVRIAWNEARQAAATVATFVQQRMTAEFPGGGRLLFRSLDDPDNARGHTADGVTIDEAGDVKQAAWYEVIRPMLIDTGGAAWLQGTPKGRNWFWREWMAAHDREDSMAWQAPTVGCKVQGSELVREPHPLENPEIPFEEIENIFRTTPVDIFRQEILAEFLEHEGSVFRNILACINAPMDTTPETHAGHRIVAGVDWGKQNDFTAISVGCATCRVELALDRFNRIDYAFQRKRLESMCNQWHVVSILAESNAMGEPVIEELVRSGLPVSSFQTTAQSKPPLIESLALAFEREEWQWLDVPIATGELEAYERKVSPATGRSQYNAPEGLHDDTVIARALMHKAGLSAPTMAKKQPVAPSKFVGVGEVRRQESGSGSRWKV